MPSAAESKLLELFDVSLMLWALIAPHGTMFLHVWPAPSALLVHCILPFLDGRVCVSIIVGDGSLAGACNGNDPFSTDKYIMGTSG